MPDTLSYLMGDPLGFLGGLFGGGSDEFQPYIKDGQVYFADNKNPVPVPDVPGARTVPGEAYQKIANQVQITSDLLPYLTQAIYGTLTPQALAELGAAKATAPGYAQLQTDLFSQYGPILNEIGNQILRQNALSSAGTDLAVLQGPGKDLVQQALDVAKLYDPEYFKNREVASQGMQDLFGSIDLSGALSPTERDEISKGLARESQQRGTAFAPSQTELVSNAMQYGQAGTARKQAAQDTLTNAINASAKFIPTTKSGVDVFQVATGKPSAANQGANQFAGVEKSDSSDNYGLAQNLLGNSANMQSLLKQIDANKSTWQDNFLKITQGMSNIGQMFGGLAGGMMGV